MYAENRFRDVAVLSYNATPVIHSSKQCLTFWYFMTGYVGRLAVYLTTNNTGVRSVVWTRTGEYGMQWLQGAVSIPAESFPLTAVGFVCLLSLLAYGNYSYTV